LGWGQGASPWYGRGCCRAAEILNGQHSNDEQEAEAQPKPKVSDNALNVLVHEVSPFC
jgi:hypothetical protein